MITWTQDSFSRTWTGKLSSGDTVHLSPHKNGPYMRLPDGSFFFLDPGIDMFAAAAHVVRECLAAPLRRTIQRARKELVEAQKALDTLLQER